MDLFHRLLQNVELWLYKLNAHDQKDVQHDLYLEDQERQTGSSDDSAIHAHRLCCSRSILLNRLLLSDITNRIPYSLTDYISKNVFLRRTACIALLTCYVIPSHFPDAGYTYCFLRNLLRPRQISVVNSGQIERHRGSKVKNKWSPSSWLFISQEKYPFSHFDWKIKLWIYKNCTFVRIVFCN